MSGCEPPRPDIGERVRELRRQLGLFSFQGDETKVETAKGDGCFPELGLRPGAVVEWVVAGQGTGAATAALWILRRSPGEGAWAVIDLGRDCYFPAFTGWGIDPGRLLVLRPVTLQETSWAIEQCLRCPGISVTWAWVDQRFPSEFIVAGKWPRRLVGGVGVFFRPTHARREPAWADLRLLVTPQPGGAGETDGFASTCCIAVGAWEAAHRAGRSTMPRVMCVWFPKWPIQRLRIARPELGRRELVLFAGHDHRPVISVCSPIAERTGIGIGQPLAEARALLPNAIFLAANVLEDRNALVQLALDGQRFSPSVGLEECSYPECLLFEVSGCTHLWEGEEAFLDAVDNYFLGRGYQIQLALAATPGAAWALAHHAKRSLVPGGHEEQALSDLPVALLRLPTDTLEPLLTLGLSTVGSVLRLPRDALVARFGLILPRRLDQALGSLPESFVCERLKEPLSAIREWEVPIEDRITLAFLCRQVLGEVLAMADRHGMGLQELEGRIETETSSVTIDIRLVEPTRDEAHLAQLAELQLERSTWSGGVISVGWSVIKLGRLEQTQRNWLGDDVPSKSSHTFSELVDRLNSRLEPGAVIRVEVLPDSQPEYALRLVPWTSAGPFKADCFTLPEEQSRGRPLRLLDRPQPIDVTSTIPGGPPIRMVWKDRDCVVARSWGPERIATGWWRGQDVERDYYRAEWEDGTHVWVYRDQREGRWFLHGFFD